MSQAFTAAAGHTLSADIAVPEHEQVKRFYLRVLTTGDRPLWRDDLMNKNGTPIIGLGARTRDHEDLNSPGVQFANERFSSFTGPNRRFSTKGADIPGRKDLQPHA